MGFLLLENGFKLLLETGDKLVLENEDVVDGSASLTGSGSLSATGFSQLPGSDWLVLAELFLDSGTEYLSNGDVSHPTRLYSGRVLSFGNVDRSIPVPVGLPQNSDATIRLADTDRALRDTLANQTPRRRIMKLKMMQTGASESARPYFFVGQVVDFKGGPGWCEIYLRDQTFAWLDEPIPNIGNRDNFPELAEGIDSFFFPIIQGINESPADNPQGIIPLPHIAFITTVDRWALACHEVWDATAIYRKEPADGMFSLVDPAEYTITVEMRTIEGIDYNLSFLDFFVEQTAGTEIRADVQGIDARGGWNGYPPVGGEVLRNPIDFFINLTFLVMTHAGAAANFDAGRIMAIRDKFALDNTYCDGCITESRTIRELLGLFLSDFNIDIFVTMPGLIALNFTDESDTGRPIFTQNNLILRGTYLEGLANPTFNQCRYYYGLNYATKEYASQKLFDNGPDQALLGEIEPLKLEMNFIRDDTTATDMTSRRMAFLAIGSYRQEFQLPLPEVVDILELARLVGITHREGFGVGGYTNKEAKVLGITANLDKFNATVRTILRVPQAMVNLKIGSASLTGYGTLSAIGGSGAILNSAPELEAGELALELFD